MHNKGDAGSVESWLISAGRDRRPGSPLNVPLYPASNFVLGEHRAYSRDDGTPVLSLPTAATGFVFAYGPGSFRRHAAAARAAGLGFRVRRDGRLGRDVDAPEDLVGLPLPLGGKGRFRALLGA